MQSADHVQSTRSARTLQHSCVGMRLWISLFLNSHMLDQIQHGHVTATIHYLHVANFSDKTPSLGAKMDVHVCTQSTETIACQRRQPEHCSHTRRVLSPQPDLFNYTATTKVGCLNPASPAAVWLGRSWRRHDPWPQLPSHCSARAALT